MDVCSAEGELESSDRGEVVHSDPELASEFEADDLGAPMGILFLQGAGLSHDLVIDRATTAVLVARLEAVDTALVKSPPDLPDGVVREAEFAGDVAKLLALEVSADDFLSDRHR
jgi:hypothetical protein